MLRPSCRSKSYLLCKVHRQYNTSVSPLGDRTALVSHKGSPFDVTHHFCSINGRKTRVWATPRCPTTVKQKRHAGCNYTSGTRRTFVSICKPACKDTCRLTQAKKFTLLGTNKGRKEGAVMGTAEHKPKKDKHHRDAIALVKLLHKLVSGRANKENVSAVWENLQWQLFGPEYTKFDIHKEAEKLVEREQKSFVIGHNIMVKHLLQDNFKEAARMFERYERTALPKTVSGYGMMVNAYGRHRQCSKMLNLVYQMKPSLFTSASSNSTKEANSGDKQARQGKSFSGLFSDQAKTGKYQYDIALEEKEREGEGGKKKNKKEKSKDGAQSKEKTARVPLNNNQAEIQAEDFVPANEEMDVPQLTYRNLFYHLSQNAEQLHPNKFRLLWSNVRKLEGEKINTTICNSVLLYLVNHSHKQTGPDLVRTFIFMKNNIELTKNSIMYFLLGFPKIRTTVRSRHATLAFRTMEAHHIAPDVRLYNLFLQHINFHHAPREDLLSFCDRMENHYGIEPDSFIYTQLLNIERARDKASCSFEYVLSLRDRMRKTGHASVDGYNILLTLAARNGHLGRQLEMLKMMEEDEIKVDKVTMNTLMRNWQRISNIDGLLATYKFWLDHLAKKPNADKPDNQSYTILLTGLKNVRKYDEALQLYNEMRKKYKIKPNKFTFNTVLRIHWEKKDLEKVAEVLEEMKRSNIQYDDRTFLVIMEMWYYARRPQKVLSTFLHMRNEAGLLIYPLVARPVLSVLRDTGDMCQEIRPYIVSNQEGAPVLRPLPSWVVQKLCQKAESLLEEERRKR